MEDLAEPQLSCASNIPSSAEAVSSSQNMHLSSEYQNLEANYNDVENQIQPTDSVSNVSRKSSKTSSRITTTTHGSHSSRSSIASARLKIEAEMAALQAHQKMLQRKHALQKEEEALRRRKEQMELDTKIAVSMAKMKVYSDVRSEISEITNPPQTNAPQIMNTRTKSLNPNVESFLPSSSYAVSQHPPASIQTQVVAENSKHFPTRTVQQPIVRSKSRSTHSALPPSIGHDGRQERGSRLQDAHGSCLQDDLDEGNILKLIDKQMILQLYWSNRTNLSSLPQGKFHSLMEIHCDTMILCALLKRWWKRIKWLCR